MMLAACRRYFPQTSFAACARCQCQRLRSQSWIVWFSSMLMASFTPCMVKKSLQIVVVLLWRVSCVEAGHGLCLRIHGAGKAATASPWSMGCSNREVCMVYTTGQPLRVHDRRRRSVSGWTGIPRSRAGWLWTMPTSRSAKQPQLSGCMATASDRTNTLALLRAMLGGLCRCWGLRRTPTPRMPLRRCSRRRSSGGQQNPRQRRPRRGKSSAMETSLRWRRNSLGTTLPDLFTCCWVV
mmetsp:Transcript_94634/g.238571  ORF Transcript_94634/g.238571 Transcript_94634/m.238571 type:complete len:238 (-) Transcript_94634:439-1152(-)